MLFNMRSRFHHPVLWLVPFGLLVLPRAHADTWNGDKATIRADARATGQAFKKAAKQVGHESVRIYHENKKTFKTVGHTVHAEVPVVKHNLRQESDRYPWIRRDYHRSISFIKRSAHAGYFAVRGAWHRLTQRRSASGSTDK